MTDDLEDIAEDAEHTADMAALEFAKSFLASPATGAVIYQHADADERQGLALLIEGERNGDDALRARALRQIDSARYFREYAEAMVARIRRAAEEQNTPDY